MSARELARSRAERYLAQRVLGPRDEPRRPPPGVDPSIYARKRRAAVDAALEVYEALGILSPADVRAWHDAAARDHRVVDPSTSSPAAIGVLERLFAAMDAAGDEAAVSEASRRFSMAHLAAGCAGLLTRADRQTWSERQQDRLAAGDEDRQRLEMMRSTHFRELRRVIPGPARRESGTTVTSVEIYADGVIANWRRVLEAGTEQRAFDMPGASLADDVGTTYVHFSGGGAGGNREQAGCAGFGPSPPTAARRLELRLGDDEFAVELAGPGTVQ